jgi:membrane-bound lytic murein transglycosylase D
MIIHTGKIIVTVLLAASVAHAFSPPERPRLIRRHPVKAAPLRLKVLKNTEKREISKHYPSFSEARRYEPRLSRTFKEAGVPLALLGLSFQESSFRANARGKGTFGVWQLKSETGRRFGLRVNSRVDERGDVLQATKSVALYLRHLHGMFNDWGLVAIAYKMGEGNLSKVLRTNSVKSFDELITRGILLPETEAYLVSLITYGILYQEYLKNAGI